MLKIKICQGTLEIISLEWKRPRQKRITLVLVGGPDAAWEREPGDVLTRGWHWVVIFGSLRFLAALKLRDAHHCLNNLKDLALLY